MAVEHGTAQDAGLGALRFGWGSAYEFGWDDESPWALRRDGLGGKIRAGDLDQLGGQVRDDYAVKHVPREFAPAEEL